MSSSLPRLTSLPLPAVAYVPGVCGARPSDEQVAVAALAVESWRSNVTYLHAFDLFNHGYYWEAHERWETLWHAAGRRGPAADVLKGLIHLAAAGVKMRQGQPRGRIGHARRAAELLRTGAGSLFGLMQDDLLQATSRAEEAREDGTEARFAFVLVPR